MSLRASDRFVLRLLAGVGLMLGLLAPITSAAQTPTIARMGIRVTSSGASRVVGGTIFALDSTGQAVPELNADTLQASIDGRPVQLSIGGGRPSIALAAAFFLDSSASPPVRNAVTNAFGDGVQGIDVNRDSVAIASTAQSAPWDQSTFTTSADDLKKSLNQVIQAPPNDAAASLEQVSGLLRVLSAQPNENRVLLLFTNRPLASAASVNASLGTIRAFAADNGIQVSIVALPGVDGQGPAEALAEATPGGRVEYVLNATNRQDITRRVTLLLAPVFGARHFEVAAPSDGTHTLSVGADGVTLQATSTFQVTAHPVQISSLLTSAGLLQPGSEVAQPTWVQAVPSENAPIDSVEWTVDGRVTQVTTEPWALLLDPDQLGEGQHDLSARIISQGHPGPIVTNTIAIPPDFLRTVRVAVRAWGLIAILLVAELVVIFLFLRMAPAGRGAVVRFSDFPPSLRLNPLTGGYVAPEVIEFPSRGKLRIGYHPPYMDNSVGSRLFSRLPYQDIRGDEEAVKDLSRHAACIWRDPKTNDCYIQLGWPGPGEALKPKPQSQVFHFGRPQDATTAPFRLAHHDIVRLATGVEFVFNQVGLRDKATPESKKLSPFEVRSASAPRVAVLSEVSRRPIASEGTSEEG